MLSENEAWTIVAYSHEVDEGDRLVFELNKLRRPLLELCVYDSDIWGYRLHSAGRKLQSGWYLVETPQAVYRFQVSAEELSAEFRQQLRAILSSFRAASADASLARDP